MRTARSIVALLAVAGCGGGGLAVPDAAPGPADGARDAGVVPADGAGAGDAHGSDVALFPANCDASPKTPVYLPPADGGAFADGPVAAPRCNQGWCPTGATGPRAAPCSSAPAGARRPDSRG